MRCTALASEVMAPRKNKKKAIGDAKPAEEEVVSSKRPLKRLKKASIASESTKEEVVSSKRPLKRLRKASIASESTPEEAAPDEKTVDAEKKGDAKEPVPTPKLRKPCSWLKLDRLDPKPESKSLPSPKQAEEVKPSVQVRASEDNKRKRNDEREEKGQSHSAANEKQNSRHERKEKEIIEEFEDKSENELGGLIFMCNAKTKPDCFRYQLMGVPAHQKEVVMNIKPGLKFFLYDYDLKVLYGVFEASSTGGMKLEPTAFGGAFPAQVNIDFHFSPFPRLIICFVLYEVYIYVRSLQVRFAVYKECLPLPESVFKKAIKDSYDEKKRKFKTELTVRQV